MDVTDAVVEDLRRQAAGLLPGGAIPGLPEGVAYAEIFKEALTIDHLAYVLMEWPDTQSLRVVARKPLDGPDDRFTEVWYVAPLVYKTYNATLDAPSTLVVGGIPG